MRQSIGALGGITVILLKMLGFANLNSKTNCLNNNYSRYSIYVFRLASLDEPAAPEDMNNYYPS